MSKNPGATNQYYWTNPNPKGNEPVKLVNPDGTLTGVTLETLQNGWGAFLDTDRKRIGQLIIERLNVNDKAKLLILLKDLWDRAQCYDSGYTDKDFINSVAEKIQGKEWT